MKTDLIEKYAPILCGSTPPVVRDPRLLMDTSGDVKIYYAPFEYINPSARIVLVGITPGPTQMVNANNEALRALQAGKSSTEAIQAAKSVGALSGSPDMTKHPLLRKYLLENFAAEVEELKDAVFVGLGPQVQKVLDRLIQERVLKPDRVMGGMLHPSGNCTYRINYLIGDRSAPIPHATNPVPYDQGRRAFRERFVTA